MFVSPAPLYGKVTLKAMKAQTDAILGRKRNNMNTLKHIQSMGTYREELYRIVYNKDYLADYRNKWRDIDIRPIPKEDSIINRDSERLDFLESLNIVVAGCDDVSNGCFLGDTTIWWNDDEESLRDAIDKAMESTN